MSFRTEFEPITSTDWDNLKPSQKYDYWDDGRRLFLACKDRYPFTNRIITLILIQNIISSIFTYT